MSVYDLIFAIANPIALAGWIALVLFPGRKVVVDSVVAIAIPALLAVAYTALIATHFADADGGFTSLGAVRGLFQSDALLLAGWLHYLAFDLFVGSWEVRTARKEGISHVFVVPCLALTFLLGPLGLLLFLIVRAARTGHYLQEA